MFKGRSNFETKVGKDLERRGIGFKYEDKQFTYDIKPYNASCRSCGSSEVYEQRKYTPDFFLGSGVIVEAKGQWTSKERKLLVSVLKKHDVDIRMLFMRDNWLTKRHKQRYSEWCDKRGIKWAVGSVPDEWC